MLRMLLSSRRAADGHTPEAQEGGRPRHLSRASGKTCFLRFVTEKLLCLGKLGYFFATPSELVSAADELLALNQELMVNNKRAYLVHSN